MTIYVEGGGNSANERSECQRGFKKFFEAAGMKTERPKVVACGPRNAAFDKFKTSMRIGTDAILLVDSEEPVRQDAATGKPVSPWVHLKDRDHWDRPDGATDEVVHLMVECMEAWFLADRDQFIAYYSKGNRSCNAKAIPELANIETVAKDRIYEYLEKASLPSGIKAKYSKGSCSFDILSVIRPNVVAGKSYHAMRLFYYLGIKQDWLKFEPPATVNLP